MRTTRRGAIQASVAALVAGISAPALAGTAATCGPDADLLALVRDFVRQEAALALIEAEKHPTVTPASIDSEQRVWDAYIIWCEIAGQIVDTRAHTSAGLRAKAEVMRLVLLRDVVDVVNGVPEPLDDMDSTMTNNRMAWSIARDLLERSAVA